MAYNTSNEYKQIIYSGDARHKLKIWLNGNELVNADNYCEKIIRYPRILPKDGSKRFSLDNFVSQQIVVILRDIDINIIQDQVEISIGTLISSNNYEYVPLGIFNIQGNPKTDKNKITITLRDNRTKFDFGYNAKPLIDASGGKATKKQILNDICEKAGVINDVTSFLGENDDIGIYDNSIKGAIYVSYIAEQAGRIPVIKRNGHLDFINLKDLTIVKIPLYLVEKYEIGDSYNIQRVVYESGIIKYETSNDETLDTLFINSANPYIQNQEHINSILQNVNGFEIDSVKTGEIMGDPAIDPYDLIQIYGYYDENNHFVDDENVVVFTTLANHTMTYTGKIINEYDTQIGLEERKNNVTISGEATYRKYAKTEYDNVNASLGIMSGQINDQNEQIALIRIQYNEILSKISDIADITVSGESNVANVTLREVNTSQPIDIKIHPINENISYLYPHIGLYPNTNLYLKVRMVRFTNITTSEIFDWVLPTNLWYYNNENYDELELSYGDGTNSTVTVTRKCAINADGTTSLLANPITETYPYPSGLVLSDGDYNVSLVGYSTGYLYVQLMAKNIYTTQFYTKAETNSIIDQTASAINIGVDAKLSNYSTTQEMNSAITVKANEINSNVSNTYETQTNAQTNYSNLSQMAESLTIEVGKKVDNEDYTKAQIVAKINDDTSSAKIGADVVDIDANDVLNILAGNAINLTSKNISINSTNFSVDKNGKITSTSGDIGGFEMNSTSFKKSLNGIYKYSLADAVLVYNVVLGLLKQNTNVNYILDYDNNGEVENLDAIKILRIINNLDQNTRSFQGSFEINTNDLKNCFLFKNNNGKTITSIGLGGINTEYIYTNNFACGQFYTTNAMFRGTLISGQDGEITIKGQNNVQTTIRAGEIVLSDGQGHTKTITASN